MTLYVITPWRKVVALAALIIMCAATDIWQHACSSVPGDSSLTLHPLAMCRSCIIAAHRAAAMLRMTLGRLFERQAV
jgi:hypothetical protein